MTKVETKASIDPMLFISINMKFLKILGQNYIQDPVCSFRYWLKIFYRNTVAMIAYVIPLSGEAIYLIYNHDELSKLADGLYLFLSEFVTPTKLSLYHAYEHEIKDLIADMTSESFKPTEPEHEDIVRFHINKTRKITAFYYIMCTAAITVSFFIPIMDDFEVHPSNVAYPYIDVMVPPLYQIFYVLIVLYKPTSVWVHCAMETLAPAFMSFAIAQLDILTFNLKNLDRITERAAEQLQYEENTMDLSTSKKQIYKLTVGKCIQHHKDIVQYIDKMNVIFNAPIGVNYMLSINVICLIGIKVLSMDDPYHQPIPLVWTVVYFLCMVCDIFMICYYGNELITKSEYIQTAVYSGPWIHLDKDIKRSIMIFSERCRRPLRLQVFKLFDVSLPTFAALMQWSYKAFAVMNTTK